MITNRLSLDRLSPAHLCGAADGLNKSLFGQDGFSHLPFVLDRLSFPLHLLGLKLFLEFIGDENLVISNGQRFAYSLSIVHLFAVIICKIVNNNRDGESHDLEKDKEGIDDQRIGV